MFSEKKTLFVWFGGAMICSTLVLADPPHKKPVLDKVEKQQVQQTRKNLFAARKIVEKYYWCQACHGVKTRTVTAPSQLMKRATDHYEAVCSECDGLGVRIGVEFYTALGEYYRQITNTDEKLRPFLEDPPTMARWVLNHVKDPQVARIMNWQWAGAELEVQRGRAFVLSVRLLDVFKNRTSKWSIALAETLAAERGESIKLLLIFPNGYTPFSDAQEKSGHASMICVAYSEGEEAYKKWLEKSRELVDKSIEKDENPEVDTIDAAEIEVLQRILQSSAAMGMILTVADGIPTPASFFKR